MDLNILYGKRIIPRLIYFLFDLLLSRGSFLRLFHRLVISACRRRIRRKSNRKRLFYFPVNIGMDAFF